MTISRGFRTTLPLVAALTLAAQFAHGQSTVTQSGELPNVMLLVDTSGSMERMSNGTLPTCTAGVESQPNRWGSLVQAMTGSVQPYFSCVAEPRNIPAFKTEFGAGFVDPYDYNYVLPYHRLLSGSGTSTCAITHDNVTGSLLTKLLNPNTFVFGAPCAFDQAADGQLDVAKDLLRLGLMTFDTLPANGTNMSGTWSYYVGAPKSGNLPACAAVDYEVGARNSTAPEWEGPLIGLPAPTADQLSIRANNDRIQAALAALRPHGGTPIDAMMEDAQRYLWNDPTGPNAPAGASRDPYVQSGCREQFIILLTDGAPNTNLRASCEGGGGACPYPNRAKDTAAQMLAGGAGPKVTTFVVGFSVNDTGAASFPSGATTCRQWWVRPPRPQRSQVRAQPPTRSPAVPPLRAARSTKSRSTATVDRRSLRRVRPTWQSPWVRSLDESPKDRQRVRPPHTPASAAFRPSPQPSSPPSTRHQIRAFRGTAT
jgi:type IV pilus assembly protein PilY1